MGSLVYEAICSLDGYIADEGGRFDWAMPSDEVHAFVNDRMRGVGTHLYGRRLYEVMAVWQDITADEVPPVEADYADLWRAADKVVYSTTLTDVATPRTRLERAFDADAAQTLAEASTRDILIGGATLAGAALRAGIVDEVALYLTPVVVGGGTRALPDGVRQDLELVDTRRFANGVVFVAYRRR